MPYHYDCDGNADMDVASPVVPPIFPCLLGRVSSGTGALWPHLEWSWIVDWPLGHCFDCLPDLHSLAGSAE
jgi:hypothetical protein